MDVLRGPKVCIRSNRITRRCLSTGNLIILVSDVDHLTVEINKCVSRRTFWGFYTSVVRYEVSLNFRNNTRDHFRKGKTLNSGVPKVPPFVCKTQTY